MVLKSVIAGQQYAELRETEGEKDPCRRKELKRIAETCRWVPANSPQSFYQAMQSLWFTRSYLRLPQLIISADLISICIHL
jgi:formate C-acetyltransferase